MSVLRGAIVGFGQVAEKAHVPAWKSSPDFQIVAVADDRAERRTLAAEVFPGIRVYTSLEELLRGEPKLDFVDIATPPALHARQTVSCLQHRLHVLCEKPLALKVQGFETLRAQALAQERVVFSVHNWKYAPLFLQAAQIVDSGELGVVRHVELHTLRSRPAADAANGSWRTDPRLAGGGILVDHGWHNFYLLSRLMGGPPSAVAARLCVPAGSEAEDEAACLFEYPDASAVLFLTWRAPLRANWGMVYGTKATLELRDDHLVLSRPDAPAQRFEFAQKLSQGSAHPDWFATMLEDFKAEVSRPKARYQSLREAEGCLSLLTHLYQSHRMGGRTVSLPLNVPVRAGRAAAS